MIELILASIIDITEPDLIICLWNEETQKYNCEEEKLRGYDCRPEFNYLVCNRLLEV